MTRPPGRWPGAGAPALRHRSAFLYAACPRENPTGMNRGIAVYPGSFDPVTDGHCDIIERAAAHFHRLLVSVAPLASHADKRPLFPLEERVALVQARCAEIANVEVDVLSGLLVDYAAARGSAVIVKGLRALSDFEY